MGNPLAALRDAVASWLAIRHMRTLDSRRSEGFEKYFNEQIELAWRALCAGDRRGPLPIWNRMRAEFPDLCLTTKTGHRILFNLGCLDEVEEILLEGRKRYPRVGYFVAAWAQVAQQRGNFEEALRRCEVAIRDFPAVFEAYLTGSRCLSALSRDSEAEAMLSDAVRKFPDKLDILVEHARCAERRNDWEQALYRYSEISRRFDDPNVALATAACLRALGRLAEAMEVLEKFCSRFPSEHSAFVELAHIHAEMNDLAKAAECWRYVRKVSPLLPLGYLEGAKLELRLGHVSKADEILAEGVSRIPTDRTLLLQHAQNAAHLGNGAAEEERWELVHKRFPDCREFRERLSARSG